MALDDLLKRELERAARPPDPDDVYEHILRRRERRRSARKVQAAALALVVSGASIAGAYGLWKVFGDGASVHPAGTNGTDQPQEGRPAVEPTATPADGGAQRGAVDIGLGFLVCRAERLGGIDFLGDGVSGHAWTAVPLKEGETCRRSTEPEDYILAVDHTGDADADTSIELPFDCTPPACPPHAATDLDGNGTEELVVAQHFSIMSFYFFAVRPDGNGGLHVEPILVAPPGHPPAGIEPAEPLWIDAGGDAGYSSSIECEGYPSDPVIVWSWEYAEIDSDAPREFHVTEIELGPDGMFHVAGRTDSSLPADTPAPIASQSELGRQCGVVWWFP